MKKAYKLLDVAELKEVKKCVENTLLVNIRTKSGYRGTTDVQDAIKIYSHICYNVYSTTYGKIGFLINKDHAAVMNQIKTCKDLLETDKIFKEKYKMCISNLPQKLTDRKREQLIKTIEKEIKESKEICRKMNFQIEKIKSLTSEEIQNLTI